MKRDLSSMTSYLANHPNHLSAFYAFPFISLTHKH